MPGHPRETGEVPPLLGLPGLKATAARGYQRLLEQRRLPDGAERKLLRHSLEVELRAVRLANCVARRQTKNQQASPSGKQFSSRKAKGEALPEVVVPFTCSFARSTQIRSH